ncbi:MAG: TrmB family transcriptional regulator [Halapricum sp.]
MTPDPTADPTSVAIEQLEQFGLSTYAAQTFVALASLGTGTARDVSRVSDVPRTRVYDAIDELHDRGLVDVRQSSPREFWAISAETATRTFKRELQHRTDLLRTALDELEPEQRQDEQRGVWTVESQQAVTQRVVEFFASAEDEIVYMTVADLLTDDLIDELREAAARGVTIKLAGVSDPVREHIEEELPDAETFESLWDWSETPAGRLLMIDREQTLVSVLVNGEEAAPSDPRSETAIWGRGETNSLVVVLKALFTWQLDRTDDSGPDPSP